ncbi:xanthine dehydrogenase small subunit [Mesorhizobium sp. Z1-4]|uniref:xanthine dehydrogenase small subunit n=1 Tax=Mesorhizobium sp. Z1-4 TaxID=2448478 RepID=UPI000FDABA43|nr:xanthine dehydrogenase small subunit [Mesorhizobium sp. Z1-4]
MAGARDHIRFLLNGTEVTTGDVRPDETLLDYLRLQRKLTGTKEGCAEGDCGACTVLVGRLSDGELVYEGVNACIRFLASVDGCHVVTVEHLRRPDGTLHPVQQAMVDHHGSQCGFCTPGFVMGLYGLWMRRPDPSEQEIETALQGNLCRCTGYEPIVKAAKAISGYGAVKDDPLVAERAEVTATLKGWKDGSRVEIGTDGERFIIPGSLDDFADAYEANPDATIVAGATDVGLWVTKFMREIAPVIFIGGLEELRQSGRSEGAITLGAGISYTAAREILAEAIPAFGELIERIGGDQVRNMGTIGGNIANGSPIGDTPPPLIALGAELTLRKGSRRRTMPLEEFFIDYGKQDRQPGEFVESVTVPLPAKGAHFAAHKITKRRDEDITAALGAFHVELAGDGTVASVRIAYGGMAATPKRARSAEAVLVGRPWSADNIEAAMDALSSDFTPISDMRASADYRMLVARNLLKRFFIESSGTKKPVTVKRYEVA